MQLTTFSCCFNLGINIIIWTLVVSVTHLAMFYTIHYLLYK